MDKKTIAKIIIMSIIGTILGWAAYTLVEVLLWEKPFMEAAFSIESIVIVIAIFVGQIIGYMRREKNK